MTFAINIVGANAEEAIGELIKAAAFYNKHPEIAADAAPKPATKPRATKAAEPTAGTATTAGSPSAEKAPESPTPASTATAAAPVQPQTAAPDAPVVVVTLEQVRAFLTPFLADPDKAPRVTALIAEVGQSPRLSGVSPANLSLLLSAAREEFA